MDWRSRAVCLDADPELFFPVGTGETAQRQAEQAKTLCLSCPVRETCLDWALAVGQDHGVWGGLDELERRRLRRQRTRLATLS